jgi:predicted transcriptional regulator
MERTSPQRLWRLFGRIGGIDRSRFFEYFAGTDEGVALIVRKARRFKEPVLLPQDGLPKRPPQSFAYLSNETLGALGQLLPAA